MKKMYLKLNTIESIVDLQNEDILNRVGEKQSCQGLLFGTHCFMPKLVRVETHLNTHCIGGAQFHPETWLNAFSNGSFKDRPIGHPKFLKRLGVLRWAMYFVRDQRHTQAFRNMQLAPYLPCTNPRLKGNVLVVKVHDLTGADDVQPEEIEWLQQLVISALHKEMSTSAS
ncbi:hypothetical protein ARMGADRAFT_1030732 [Armillaria gallica]|uniref:Uncharacterized protein n=1 Tax=Armillaria gallica TaxID=47427 RepID=A0A2H3DB25_ARMGA|nr:hypothetical protein ARMGADRAFT_1030732 [Armillaria gallica]